MASYHRPQSRARARAALVLCGLLGACALPDGSASEGTDEGVSEAPSASAAAPVRPGVDVLFRDSLHLVRGRRVGLITNPTGMDAAGRSTIDRLFEHPDVELVTLFAPEHGLRAAVGEGQRIEDSQDPSTGLPVVSLYTGTKFAPSVDDLAAVDVVVFDMQDIGARYYTYVSTMSVAMEAAGEAGVPFVVLDRPNPIGGSVQGNVLDPAYATFVGRYPVPMRHGMTAGELARLYQGRFGVEVELSVVPVDGWDASVRFDATGLPWVPPSPNIPDLTSALHYAGTCLFEGTNLSAGRGTDRPFQQVGAPWLDGAALAARLNERGLPGVRFEAVTFTPADPSDGKWGGESVSGVRFVAADPELYDPTAAAVAALAEARRMSGDRWSWNVAHFDRLAGTDALRLGLDAGTDPADLMGGWAEQRSAFEALAAPYRLYPR